MSQAKQGAMTWVEFVKANMGPAMRQFSAEGLSHAEAHTKAIRQIAEQWQVYKTTGVEANAGVVSAAKSVAAPLADGARHLDRLGTSAANSARMMRQVAPQFTDMVTQIAAGQSPLQILIQQGGQLKDVFGGVGPAARALGGYVASMITPLSVAAVAVGVLSYAALSGADQIAKFERQVLLSGNAAGGTVSQYRAMAVELAKIGGTQGAALDAIGQFAQHGRVAAENLQRYVGIAQQLDRLVGKPVADTVKEFEALAESPVEASVKLAQSYNHLTATTLRQIKALKDAGEHTQAAELAQKALADTLQQRMPEMERNVGTLERVWRGLKDVVSGVADAMLEIGRPRSAQQQADQAAATVATLQAQIASRKGRGLATGDLERQLAAARALVPATQALIAEEAKAALLGAERAKQREAESRFGEALNQSLSVREQRERRIEQIKLDGANAQRKQEDIDKAVAAAREKMVDPKEQDALGARLARLQQFQKVQAEITRSGVEQVAAAYRQGLSSEVEYIERTGALEVQQLERDRQFLQSKIALAKQKANSQREVAELEGEAAVIEEQIASRRKKTADDVATTQAQRAKKAREALAAEVTQWKSEWAQADKAAQDRYSAATEMVKQYVSAVKLESEAVEFEISLMGRSGEEQRKLIELRRIEIRLLEEKRKIEKRAEGGNLTAGQRQVLLDEAETAAAEARANVATRIWIDKWTQTNQDVGETLYDVLTGRTRDAARRAQAIFENLVLRPTIMAAVQPLSGAITSAITGGPAASGVNGLATSVMGNVGGSALSSYLGSALSSASYAAAVPGLTSFGVGSQAAMLAAQTAEFGAAGLSATAAAGGAGAVTTALAAIPVWGWAAMAAMAIAAIGKMGGETRVGGQYSGTTLIDSPSGGPINNEATATAIAATIGQTNALLKGLGSSAAINLFRSGLEQSEHGKGFAYARGTLTTGAQFGNWGVDGYMQNRGSMTAEQATEKFAQELKQATLQALQAADVPGQLGDYLRQLGDIEALSGGALDAALSRINKALSERQQLEEQLYILTHTELEVLNRNRERERDALDESNRALFDQVTALHAQKVATEEAKRSQEELARTLTGELDDATRALAQARRAEYDGMRASITALESSASRYRSFASDLRRFRDSLLLGDLSPLTPGQRYAESRRIAEETYARALTGDQAAMGQIESVAQEFLRASQVYNASGDAYLRDFSVVQSYLALGADKADEAAAWAQAQAAIGNAQLSALGTINASVQTVAQAIESLKNAGIAVLGAGGTIGDEPLREYISALVASGRTTDAYHDFKATGRTLAQANTLMNWGAGTAEQWARDQGLPIYHDGIASVPKTGPALLQAGETVLKRGGQDAMLRELQQLRAEVAALRAEHRQGVVSRNATTIEGARLTVQGVTAGGDRRAFERQNAAEAVPQ